MHEESVRVPMFAFGVGIPKGIKTSSLVSALDLYPTIIELSGSALPTERIGGKSLLPLFENPESHHHNIIFSKCVGVGSKPGEGHRMARNDNYKLILADNNEIFFFDLKNDPFEKNNLTHYFQLNKETIREQLKLSKQLKVWMKEIGDRNLPELD